MTRDEREMERRTRNIEESQKEALSYARRVKGRGLLERIAQIVVDKSFDAQVEREIAKLRTGIVSR